MNKHQKTVFGTVDGVGLYGDELKCPGLTINGVRYKSTLAMSQHAAGMFGKPVMAEVESGCVTSIRPVTAECGEAFTDRHPSLERLFAAAEQVDGLLAGSALNLSVRLHRNAEPPSGLEFHVWDDATDTMLDDDAPATYGVLLWLGQTCTELATDWINQERAAMEVGR